MSDAPGSPPSAPVAMPAAAPEGKPDEPRKRRWFVVLAWVTLVGFGIFTAAITVISIALPAIRFDPNTRRTPRAHAPGIRRRGLVTLGPLTEAPRPRTVRHMDDSAVEVTGPSTPPRPEAGTLLKQAVLAAAALPRAANPSAVKSII